MATDLLSSTVGGDGPPLILLNGALMSCAAWDPLAAVLLQSFRVVRCDFRGQLLSPGDGATTMDGHAADVLRVMDALGLDSAHVAGVSFGALAGLTMAARAPSRVRSLVAITGTDRVAPETLAHINAMRAACRAALAGGDGGVVFDLVTPATWSPAFLAAQPAFLTARRQAVAALPRPWFSGLDQLLGALDGLDLRPLLPDIACPTLVIGGDADRTFAVGQSRELAARIPGARLIVVPGGSHGLVFEHAPEVIAWISDMVRTAELRLGAPA